MQYKHTQGERHIVLSSCQCFLFFAAKQAEEVLQQLPDTRKTSTLSAQA